LWAGRRGGGRSGFVQYAASLTADLFCCHAESAKYFHRHAFHADQSEKDMLGSNVMMSEAAGFIHCIFKDLLGVCGKFDAVGVEIGRTAAGDALNYFAYALGCHAQFAQDTACHTTLFIH
jgi:hypothetical protein